MAKYNKKRKNTKIYNLDRNGNKTNIPTRKNRDEKRQLKLAARFQGYSADKTKFLSRGGLISREEANARNSGVFGYKRKTIDGLIDEGGILYPLYCRFTGQSGGSQNSRFHDLLTCIDECPNSDNENGIHPIFVLGGNYYYDNHNKFQGFENEDYFNLPVEFNALQVLEAYARFNEKRCSFITEEELKEHTDGETKESNRIAEVIAVQNGI